MTLLELPEQFNLDFAIPGEQTKGLVEINWEKHITHGLIQAISPIGGVLRDYTNPSVFFTLQDAADAISAGVAPKADGLAAYIDSSGTSDKTRFEWPRPDGYRTVKVDESGRGFSIFLACRSFGGNGDTAPRIFDDNAFNIQIVTDQFHFRMKTGTNQFMVTDTVSGLLTDGLLHTFAAINNGIDLNNSNFVLKIDDLSIDPSGGGGAGIIETAANLTLGNETSTNDATPDHPFDGEIYALYMWDRMISSDEYLSIRANMYQIFKPVVPMQMFVPAQAALDLNLISIMHAGDLHAIPWGESA